MDYNDIKSRIERTLHSLKGRFDEDISKHTHFEVYEIKGEKRVSITFGTEDEKVLINPIMNILHNLANLKDNLKNCLKEKGYNPQIIENEIKNSLHLQVLMDIINQEKHGSPLKNPRSFKNPVIKEPSQSFRMGSVIRDLDGNIIDKNGPPVMQIDADIRDDKENYLFSLDALVETCFAKWALIARNHGCRE